MIWIGHPIEIPPITLNELKKDPVWSKKGLIKANMQGVSGRPCSQEEYSALLSILKQKNFDISVLPTLHQNSLPTDYQFNYERDVEIYLLEPFLKRLGLTENDWLRQMPLRMGTRLCYYPDYVILPNTRYGNESGVIICEAKYRIQSKKVFLDNFFQAKSYAKRLEAEAVILASCEGLWISYAYDNYDIDKVKFFDWRMLGQSDIFYAIKINICKLLKK